MEESITRTAVKNQGAWCKEWEECMRERRCESRPSTVGCCKRQSCEREGSRQLS